MNLKKYIQSGILENYVLGLLSTEEHKTTAQTINQYPELKAEMIAIEKALEFYAISLKVKVPTDLGSIITRQFESDNRSSTSP